MGLYYQGSLKFGKLNGNGFLLLNMVDISNMESEETKKNLLYKGEFVRNKIEGKGILYYQDGVRFEGGFQDGMAHGSGQLFKGTRLIVGGIWIRGKLDL